MTLAEQGAYRNLLDELWLRNGELPADERILAKVCGDAMEWSRVRGAVLARFERIEGGGWRNQTHDEVSAYPESQAKKGHARAASADRINGRFASPPPAEAPAEHQPPSPSPDPISGSDLRKEPPATSAGDSRFERFWASYPNKKGKDAARAAWKKRHPTEALTDIILAALERQKAWPEWQRQGGQFIPHPATWLNRASWDDEPNGTTSAQFYQPWECPHTPRCPHRAACAIVSARTA